MFRSILKTPIRLSVRYLPRRFLTYIPHAFTTEVASAKIASADAKRTFAPIVINKSGLTPYQGNPLKKVLIPCFGVDTEIASTSYRGQYGIDRTVEDTTYSTDSEGKTTSTTTYRTETDWYDIDGSVGAVSYTPEQPNMTIYGGFSWSSRLIENALEGYTFLHNLKPFDSAAIDLATHIDPFLKRSAIAQEAANGRIRSEEIGRIKADISHKSGYSQTRVGNFNIRYRYSKLNTYLLPAYVLQYPDHPPRILPALSPKDEVIYGPKQFSVTKCAGAGAVVGAAATTLVSVFFPQLAIPLRLIPLIASGSGVLSGLWAQYQGGHIQYHFQRNGIDQEIENNESVSETIADNSRFHATARNFPKPDEKLSLSNEFYETLGLDPNKSVTKEMVAEAFNAKIKMAHPDMKSGSATKARNVLNAKKEFDRVLNNTPKRTFATYVPQRQAVKIPPRSVYDPNTNKLITLVIDRKDYKAALVMVQKGEVIPDGHDKGENTLITEIAERGSVQDLMFAIDKLGCSVDTSCDCPIHNTALHYAAKRGDAIIVEALLKRNATVNLINSRGETALDVASQSNVIKLLSNYGGVRHTTLEGMPGFFARTKGSTIGYSPAQRTLISEQQKKPLMLKK